MIMKVCEKEPQTAKPIGEIHFSSLLLQSNQLSVSISFPVYYYPANKT